MKKIVGLLFICFFACLSGCSKKTKTTTTTEKPKVVVSSIEIAKEPWQTTYEQYETLSLDGGQLTINYSDSSSKNIFMDESMITNSVPMTALGNHTVLLEYGGYQTSFSISVVLRSIKDINVEDIDVFYDGEFYQLNFDSVDEDDQITYEYKGITYSTNPSFDNIGTYEISYNIKRTGFDDYNGKATIHIKRDDIIRRWLKIGDEKSYFIFNKDGKGSDENGILYKWKHVDDKYYVSMISNPEGLKVFTLENQRLTDGTNTYVAEFNDGTIIDGVYTCEEETIYINKSIFATVDSEDSLTYSRIAQLTNGKYLVTYGETYFLFTYEDNKISFDDKVFNKANNGDLTEDMLFKNESTYIELCPNSYIDKKYVLAITKDTQYNIYYNDSGYLKKATLNLSKDTLTINDTVYTLISKAGTFEGLYYNNTFLFVSEGMIIVGNDYYSLYLTDDGYKAIDHSGLFDLTVNNDSLEFKDIVYNKVEVKGELEIGENLVTKGLYSFAPFKTTEYHFDMISDNEDISIHITDGYSNIYPTVIKPYLCPTNLQGLLKDINEVYELVIGDQFYIYVDVLEESSLFISTEEEKEIKYSYYSEDDIYLEIINDNEAIYSNFKTDEFGVYKLNDIGYHQYYMFSDENEYLVKIFNNELYLYSPTEKKTFYQTNQDELIDVLDNYAFKSDDIILIFYHDKMIIGDLSSGVISTDIMFYQKDEIIMVNAILDGEPYLFSYNGTTLVYNEEECEKIMASNRLNSGLYYDTTNKSALTIYPNKQAIISFTDSSDIAGEIINLGDLKLFVFNGIYTVEYDIDDSYTVYNDSGKIGKYEHMSSQNQLGNPIIGLWYVDGLIYDFRANSTGTVLEANTTMRKTFIWDYDQTDGYSSTLNNGVTCSEEETKIGNKTATKIASLGSYKDQKVLEFSTNSYLTYYPTQTDNYLLSLKGLKNCKIIIVDGKGQVYYNDNCATLNSILTFFEANVELRILFITNENCSFTLGIKTYTEVHQVLNGNYLLYDEVKGLIDPFVLKDNVYYMYNFRVELDFNPFESTYSSTGLSFGFMMFGEDIEIVNMMDGYQVIVRDKEEGNANLGVWHLSDGLLVLSPDGTYQIINDTLTTGDFYLSKDHIYLEDAVSGIIALDLIEGKLYYEDTVYANRQSHNQISGYYYDTSNDEFLILREDGTGLHFKNSSCLDIYWRLDEDITTIYTVQDHSVDIVTFEYSITEELVADYVKVDYYLSNETLSFIKTNYDFLDNKYDGYWYSNDDYILFSENSYITYEGNRYLVGVLGNYYILIKDLTSLMANIQAELIIDFETNELFENDNVIAVIFEENYVLINDVKYYRLSDFDSFDQVSQMRLNGMSKTIEVDAKGLCLISLQILGVYNYSIEIIDANNKLLSQGNYSGSNMLEFIYNFSGDEKYIIIHGSKILSVSVKPYEEILNGSYIDEEENDYFIFNQIVYSNDSIIGTLEVIDNQILLILMNGDRYDLETLSNFSLNFLNDKEDIYLLKR